MIVEILTPETTVFSTDDASLVQLPGIDGYFEILNSHAAMITVLGKGTGKIVDGKEDTYYFSIEGGVVEILSNKVLILAEKCTKK